jgi:hypothetical protein
MIGALRMITRSRCPAGFSPRELLDEDMMLPGNGKHALRENPGGFARSDCSRKTLIT